MKNQDLKPVALEILRYKQRKRMIRETVLLDIFAAEWFASEEMNYTDEYRRKKCLDKLREILGGPEKTGWLQQKQNQVMAGILARLQEDFENLTPVEILVFSHSAAGLTNDLSARLSGLRGPKSVSVIKTRLRKRFLRSDSPFAHEYLALLPKKGCRFGEEMLYLHNLKYENNGNIKKVKNQGSARL